MEYRTLGSTGLTISEIGFGCGDTAGLMISGTPDQRRDAVKHALDLGITYFDTAPVYGETRSEANLGQALRELGVRPVVATKVRLVVEDLEDPAAAVVRSVDESLARLGLDSVDVIHLHNRVASRRGGNVGSGPLIAIEDALGPGGVLEGLRKVKEQGKTRAIGLCGFGGEVACINQAIDSGGFDSILVYYNLLNPTAGMPAQPGFSGADYGDIMSRAAAQGMGVVVLRILAGGALSGQETRHPLARGRPAAEYEAELARARNLRFLVEEGEETMAHVAIRFGLMRPEVSTVLVGVSAPEHLDVAASCSGAGRLPPAALDRLNNLYRANFANE